jgi:predicted acylesterase/phospholipase RssA
MLGADFIISVVISADFSKNNVSNIFTTLVQAIYIQGSRLDEQNIRLSDFVIRPNVKNVSVIDFSHSQECIEAGMIAAKEVMPALKKMLIDRVAVQQLFE